MVSGGFRFFEDYFSQLTLAKVRDANDMTMTTDCGSANETKMMHQKILYSTPCLTLYSSSVRVFPLGRTATKSSSNPFDNPNIPRLKTGTNPG